MQHPIHPTRANPLVLLTNETQSFVTFKKYWVETHLTSQYLFTSIFRRRKQDNCKAITSLSNLIGEATWSEAKKSTEPNRLLFLYLNPSTNELTIDTFIRPMRALTEKEKLENYQFALNPSLVLSTDQARALWYYLDMQGKNEKASPSMQIYLSKWPGIDRTDLNNVTDYQKNPLWSETTFSPHTQTLEDALFQKLAADKFKKDHKDHALAAALIPPTLSFVPNQPTTQPTKPILIINPISHSYTLPKNQPTGYYTLSIVHTEQTITKSQREVLYATPIDATDKNPNKEPFALCPLKSTTALLFWNSNPKSPTFEQPIVVAINAHSATQEQLSSFLTNYASFLSPLQLASLANHTHPHPHPHNPTPTPTPNTNPTHSTNSNTNHYKDTNMATIYKQCKHCGQGFTTNRDTNMYCSPTCRIDHNAGKVYGEVSSKPARTPPVIQPQSLAPTPAPDQNPAQAPVTQAQFEQQTHVLQSLATQMAALVQLLTPKQ